MVYGTISNVTFANASCEFVHFVYLGRFASRYCSSRFADFPECTARDEFRTFLLTRLTSALCVGNLRTVQKENPSYAFDLHVSFSDFEPSYSPTDDEVSEAARQILEVRTKIEETSGLKDLLSNLRELPNEVCSFLCANLQSWRVELSNSDSIVCEFLNDNEWRKAVFQRLPLDALGNLVSFLTDWQLQHDENGFCEYLTYSHSNVRMQVNKSVGSCYFSRLP